MSLSDELKIGEHFPQHISIKPKSPLCSYCGDVMNFTSNQVKRPVPPRAKDLGIYDKIYCWKCQRCNGTSTECLFYCKCGNITIDSVCFDYPFGREDPKQEIVENNNAGLYGYIVTNIDKIDNFYSYGCISCISCSYCGKN